MNTGMLLKYTKTCETKLQSSDDLIVDKNSNNFKYIQ